MTKTQHEVIHEESGKEGSHVCALMCTVLHGPTPIPVLADCHQLGLWINGSQLMTIIRSRMVER